MLFLVTLRWQLQLKLALNHGVGTATRILAYNPIYGLATRPTGDYDSRRRCRSPVGRVARQKIALQIAHRAGCKVVDRVVCQYAVLVFRYRVNSAL